MAKAKTKSTLPLEDPRWWSHAETLQYCRARPLFRLVDLVAAVRQEQVACKFEYRDEPAQRKAYLLTAAFFEHKADIVEFWNSLALKPRNKLRLLPHTLSFWEPDLKKFLPERIATEASETTSAPAEQQPRQVLGATKHTCKSWVCEIVKQHPLECMPPEWEARGRGGYAAYLKQWARKDWDVETIRNALAREGLTPKTAHKHTHTKSTKNPPRR